MNYVGLRITCNYGVQYQIKVTPVEATRVMNEWKNNPPEFMGGVESFPGGITWWVKTKEIIAMHTFELPQTTNQTSTPQSIPYSGLGAR